MQLVHFLVYRETSTDGTLDTVKITSHSTYAEMFAKLSAEENEYLGKIVPCAAEDLDTLFKYLGEYRPRAKTLEEVLA